MADGKTKRRAKANTAGGEAGQVVGGQPGEERRKRKKRDEERVEEAAAEAPALAQDNDDKPRLKKKKEKNKGKDKEALAEVGEDLTGADGPAGEPTEQSNKKKKKESKGGLGVGAEGTQPADGAGADAASPSGEAKAAASEKAADGKKRKERSEKGELRRKLRAEAVAARIASGEDVVPKKQKGEREVKGASSLREEAEVLRQRLGLSSAPEANNEEQQAEQTTADGDGDKEAPAAKDPEPPAALEPAAAASGGGFKFGFAVNPKVEAEMEARVARLSGMVRSKEGDIIDAAEQQTDGCRVFVGGLPFSYDEAAIRGYWEYCGEVEEVDMMTFPDSGNFRGIALVTFKTKEAAALAVSYDGEDCDGRTLKVELATRRRTPRQQQQRRQHAGPAPKTPGYNVLYVGNLAFEATPEEIEAHFSGCKVTKVRIHTDQESGKPKGYAHVHVEDEASMDAAVAYDKSELHGRPMRVMFAQPKRT